MVARRSTAELGQNILMVMDNCPDCLDILRNVVARIPGIASKSFTMIHCCPTIYWEHGGGENPEAQRDAKAVIETEVTELKTTRLYFDLASSILKSAGVPESQIHVKASLENSLVDATMTELWQGCYSDVMVGSQYTDIINRLERRGLTDRFRLIPPVRVWTFDTESTSEMV